MTGAGTATSGPDGGDAVGAGEDAAAGATCATVVGSALDARGANTTALINVAPASNAGIRRAGVCRAGECLYGDIAETSLGVDRSNPNATGPSNLSTLRRAVAPPVDPAGYARSAGRGADGEQCPHHPRRRVARTPLRGTTFAQVANAHSPPASLCTPPRCPPSSAGVRVGKITPPRDRLPDALRRRGEAATGAATANSP